MLNITGAKVAIPSALFVALSPGFLTNTFQTSYQQVLFNALIFVLVYHLIATMIGLVLTQRDLIMGALLFVLMNPGMLVSANNSGVVFFSGQTNLNSIIIQAFIYAVVLTQVR